MILDFYNNHLEKQEVPSKIYNFFWFRIRLIINNPSQNVNDSGGSGGRGLKLNQRRKYQKEMTPTERRISKHAFQYESEKFIMNKLFDEGKYYISF